MELTATGQQAMDREQRLVHDWRVSQAKRICRACPAQAPCLAWALDHGVGSGVWGGATEAERRVLRRPAERNRSSADHGYARK